MVTQATTWPQGLYESNTPAPAISSTGKGKSTTESFNLKGVFQSGTGLLFAAVFAAELVLVVAGIGMIVASVAALAW